MNLSRLAGTPWHAERVHRGEGDSKRHKSRCEYYKSMTNECEKRNGKCIGSAHCVEYKELSRYALANRKRAKAAKDSDDGPFWY